MTTRAGGRSVVIWREAVVPAGTPLPIGNQRMTAKTLFLQL